MENNSWDDDDWLVEEDDNDWNRDDWGPNNEISCINCDNTNIIHLFNDEEHDFQCKACGHKW